MRIFLIRHGETVDNVANVYAGVKDSALTVHGVLQSERLGKYFADNGLLFNHVFSSDLQRAYKTANAIRFALRTDKSEDHADASKVTALPVLREQDFGSYEGKPFYARPRVSHRPGQEHPVSDHEDDPDFKDVESKDAMASRSKSFLQEHLMPIIQQEASVDTSTVAIVSHGIFLSQLWKSLLLMLPKQSVALSPGLLVGNSGNTSLEHLGGWSNTGYLELEIHSRKTAPTGREVASLSELLQEKSEMRTPSPLFLSDLETTIRTVNGKEHLNSLKRTRGGVGSSRHDESQKKIESFFKKRKV